MSHTETNLKILDAKLFLNERFSVKYKDLKALEKSLILLSKYHALPLDNEQFNRQYRHLISLYRNLCKQKGINKCLM